MSDKPGRNDECSCGSGKKYKKCCLVGAEKERAERLPYQQMLEIEGKLVPKLVNFADETFGQEALDDAWDLFVDDADEEPFVEDDPMNAVFIPWFLYSWTVETPDERAMPTAPLGKTVVEAFLQSSKGRLLPADEKRFLEAVNRRPFSIMEVKEIIDGKQLRAYDMFLDKEYVVADGNASEGLLEGDLILAAVFWPLEPGEPLFMSVAPFPVSPARKPMALEFLKELHEENEVQVLTEELLREEQLNVFSYYMALLEADDPEPSDADRREDISTLGSFRL